MLLLLCDLLRENYSCVLFQFGKKYWAWIFLPKYFLQKYLQYYSRNLSYGPQKIALHQEQQCKIHFHAALARYIPVPFFFVNGPITGAISMFKWKFETKILFTEVTMLWCLNKKVCVAKLLHVYTFQSQSLLSNSGVKKFEVYTSKSNLICHSWVNVDAKQK